MYNPHGYPWPPGCAGHGHHRAHSLPANAGFLKSGMMNILGPIILCCGELGSTLEDVSPHPWSPILPAVTTGNGYRHRPGSPTRQKSPPVDSHCSESSPNRKLCPQSHLLHKAEYAPRQRTPPNCALRSCGEALSPPYFKFISILILYPSPKRMKPSEIRLLSRYFSRT